jgi:ADP-ribosyl-[dinitrogen reductase] hydrolase
LVRLGGGWVGEEALAIAVTCAIGAPDFHDGVLAAVNHAGDSDSTGTIAGNLLGAIGGTRQLPPGWLSAIELGDVIAAQR